MQRQFVTYEIALKLKECGFNEPTFGLYKNSILYRDYETFQWTDFSNTIKAPLWSQIIDWLRNEHNLNITFLMGHDEESVWYDWHISKIEKSYDYTPIASSDNGYDYNKTREAAILKAIEILNSPQNGIRNTTI